MKSQDLGFMTLTMSQTDIKKNVSSELEPDQGEGIRNKLKFAARQLNDRIQLHTLGGSEEYSELPTTLEHDQIIVSQSDDHPCTSSGNNIISAE